LVIVLFPETTLDSLKKLLGVSNDESTQDDGGIEFIQINDAHQLALIVCKVFDLNTHILQVICLITFLLLMFCIFV